MILTNIESVPGMNIVAQYGLVAGSTVRAKNAIKDFGAGLKNMVGGELKSYTELLIEARKEATARNAGKSIGSKCCYQREICNIFCYGWCCRSLYLWNSS